MYKKVIILLIMVCFSAILAQADEWEFLGLSGKQILSISIAPDNTQNICAGTDAGLYYSSDGGQNWELKLSSNTLFPFLSYLPYSSDTLITLLSGGTWSDGIYFSTDDGNSWTTGNYFINPRRLGFDPINPGYVYICFPDGILTSIDYGQNVSSANNGLPNLNILDVKGDGSHLYEAYAVGEAFLAHTTDFGNNWAEMNGLFGLEDYNPSRIEFAPDNPDTLYVTCYAYFARSFNGGASWQYTSMPTYENMPIVCDPDTPGKLYVGSASGGGVLESNDAGANFISMNQDIGNLNIYSLELDAYKYIYAGTGDGVYKYNTIVNIAVKEPVLPQTVSLSQNYPNPFNSQTFIKIQTDSSQMVWLEIYDIAGRLTRTLFEGYVSGEKSLIWDGADNNGSIVSSGIYLYSLKTADNTVCRKMTLLK
ncbi:MAG: T9SS type A sorting domain-containing protein [candidate division Zixibacteria bacterium]|nr:T9SS type A sorting domain-containing protein [candidate division Zixibacteria bacterium]